MNKSAIKNYAIWARRKLLESVKQRAFEVEITDGGVIDLSLDTVAGRPLSTAEKVQRGQLIDEIRTRGYEAVMEEAAYTWFNRFIALRFMEVNGYLPSKVRVFTDENGEFKPEVMKQALSIDLDGLDRNRVLALLDAQDNEGLYRYLLITQCNALNEALPYMFETISNWTELLFPANLLRPDSVLGRMISDIPEKDWTDAIQIIGWLYQYYNSELKDETYDLLKKNIKISKERLPSATQLFTPDWIVRYMVENSLGRIAVNRQLSAVRGQISETERIAKEKEIAERFGWKYYLPEAKQDSKVREQLNQLSTVNYQLSTIKFLDPCMGSGHILVYAFDVLMQLYIAEGWSEREASKSILENNLIGLDIDNRSGQLAYFAVMMKARKYNRRIFSVGIRPNIFAIQDSDFINNDLVRFIADEDAELQDTLWKLKETFCDAKEYGSLIHPDIPGLSDIRKRVQNIAENTSHDLIDIHFRNIVTEKLLPLINQTVILTQKYDVVCTNPPYMSSSQMSITLSEFVKQSYPNSKGDLFSAFIERNLKILNAHGFNCMITMHSWMFLSSFESMRRNLIQNHTLINMLHLGARGFDEIGGEVVQTTAFTFQNKYIPQYKGMYCRMVDPKSETEKKDLYLSGENRYTAYQESFCKIPGSPFAYWVGEGILKSFENPKLGEIAEPRQGMTTSDNNRFLRLWFECEQSRICFDAGSIEEAEKSKKKWFPYNKGGTYKKWYGNNEFIVNYENNGKEMKQFHNELNKTSSGGRIKNQEFYFKDSITWTFISNPPGFRSCNKGFIFDVAGSSIFVKKSMKYYILGLLCSNVTKSILSMINPTMNTQSSDIRSIPIVIDHNRKENIDLLVDQNINMTKTDWDSFETSLDFKKHPLL